jgi:hypothetical protein
MMIRTDATAYSWFVHLVAGIVGEKKLVSDFALMPFYFFLTLFLWWSCSA